MTTEAPKSPLRQLADIMSEHRSLQDMQQMYDDDSSEYEAMDRELATRALHIIDTEGLHDLSNPLVTSAQRFAKRYAESEDRLYAGYPTDKQRSDEYKSGALYRSLSGRSKELIDKLMLDLMNGETLNDIGTVVRSPKEAADALGLSETDVERAYGLLSDVSEYMNPTDTLEFMAISFDQPERIPRIADESEDQADDESETEPDGTADTQNTSYELSDRYVARVRKNEDGQVMTLVMDAVPISANNAAYVLRNEDGIVEDISSAIATKRSASANGARRVLHTKTGEHGTLHRINRLLAAPLYRFRDPSYRPR